MKLQLKAIAYFLVAFILPTQLSAQRVLNGADAHNKFKHAELVRESIHSDLPSYIKFRADQLFDIDELPKWMASNFKLDANIDFKLLREEPDNLGHVHYRYQQMYAGYPIEHSMWIAHTKSDKVYAINGMIYNKITSPTSASLSEEAALDKALEYVGADVYKWELEGEEEHLKHEQNDETATYFPTGELVHISLENSFNANAYRLAYKFNIYAHDPVSRAYIYVDANNGEIIDKDEIIKHIDTPGTANTAYSGEREIIADSFGSEYRLRDGTRGDGVNTYDLNEGTSYGAAVDFTDDDNYWDNVNPERDEYATDAHWGAEMTYDYYFLEHGRNSIDNTGFALNSYVHYSADFVNAFWDGSRMTYGDGSGGVTPLTSLDIAGHEVTHGLTTFTAGLIYEAESGALNESFSDIFGNAIERYARPGDYDWLVGAEIGLTLRSMSNPNAYGDPDTYFGDDWAPLDGGDSGGVHTNSGVQNFWFYLLTEGGSGTNDNGDDYVVEAIGIEDAGAVAFRNLTVYLTPGSNHADARFYAIQSAIDLFGTCTFEVEQTANAWYAVGVGDVYNPVAVADFFTPDTVGCTVPWVANFENTSENAITYEWDFGDGETSTETNPSHMYMAEGVYSVTLYADGGDCGTDEVIFTDYITVNPELDCILILPVEGSATTQLGCDGTVFDSGGPDGDYGSGEDAQVTISPFGAETVDLTFPSFNVEPGPGVTCDYDYVEIYDGPDVFSPLIGRFCDNELPTDLSSSGSSITIFFHSDGFVQDAGFEIQWSCNIPEDAPEANFTSNTTTSCDGIVHFLDLSTNAPTEWSWDFGDGETSTDQNPSHVYTSEGTYEVSLTATNFVGSDTYTVVDYVSVSFPEAPTAEGDINCPGESATLTGSGVGILKWYDVPTGGSPLYEGDIFNTPAIDEATTYYVEDDQFEDPSYVGPVDNTFGGGGFFAGDQHLVFSNPSPVYLHSVDVYANGSGIRNIELRDVDGTLIESRSVNIPSGESTVILDLELPVGDNLQLGTALGSEPDLYRNNSGGPAYPFTLAESVVISSSSAGPDYYYFFYNWEIHPYNCVSDRLPVLADVEEESDITITPVEPVCVQSSEFDLDASEGGGTWSATCASCIDNETGTFDPAVAGEGEWVITYTVEGTCSFMNTITIEVVDCLGTDEWDDNQVKVYPNPTRGSITVDLGAVPSGTIVVKDLLGKVVTYVTLNNSVSTIDLEGLSARGTYLVEFYDHENRLITIKKVVKQ